MRTRAGTNTGNLQLLELENQFLWAYIICANLENVVSRRLSDAGRFRLTGGRDLGGVTEEVLP